MAAVHKTKVSKKRKKEANVKHHTRIPTLNQTFQSWNNRTDQNTTIFKQKSASTRHNQKDGPAVNSAKNSHAVTEDHGGYHIFEQAINEDGDALGAHFESKSNQHYPANVNSHPLT